MWQRVTDELDRSDGSKLLIRNTDGSPSFTNSHGSHSCRLCRKAMEWPTHQGRAGCSSIGYLLWCGLRLLMGRVFMVNSFRILGCICAAQYPSNRIPLPSRGWDPLHQHSATWRGSLPCSPPGSNCDGAQRNYDRDCKHDRHPQDPRLDELQRRKLMLAKWAPASQQKQNRRCHLTKPNTLQAQSALPRFALHSGSWQKLFRATTGFCLAL